MAKPKSDQPDATASSDLPTAETLRVMRALDHFNDKIRIAITTLRNELAKENLAEGRDGVPAGFQGGTFHEGIATWLLEQHIETLQHGGRVSRLIDRCVLSLFQTTDGDESKRDTLTDLIVDAGITTASRISAALREMRDRRAKDIAGTSRVRTAAAWATGDAEPPSSDDFFRSQLQAARASEVVWRLRDLGLLDEEWNIVERCEPANDTKQHRS